MGFALQSFPLERSTSSSSSEVTCRSCIHHPSQPRSSLPSRFISYTRRHIRLGRHTPNRSSTLKSVHILYQCYPIQAADALLSMFAPVTL